MISRIRSRPANASVICVPIDEIWMTGAMTSPVKKMYWIRAPSLHAPLISARPPITIISAPISPMTSVETDVTADTPVTALATFRNSRCAPRAKTSCSRFSTPYAFTTRMPPSVSASRPVTSALIFPRSRKTGRSFEKPNAIVAPKRMRMKSVRLVSRQFR